MSKNAENPDANRDNGSVSREVNNAINAMTDAMDRMFSAIDAGMAQADTPEDKMKALVGAVGNELQSGFERMGLQTHNAQEMKNAIFESLDLFHHNLSPELETKFLQHQDELRRQRKMAKLKHELEKQDPEQYSEDLTDELNKTFIEASQQEIESVYAAAYKFYNSGQYDTAANFFQLLAGIRPEDSRFHFGLGSCFFMAEEYEQALASFAMSYHFKEDQPLVLFFIGKCNIKLKHFPQAKKAFEKSLELMTDKTAFKDHIEHAQNMLGLIEKKLDKS